MLKTIENKVLTILEACPDARNSDKALIDKYVEWYCPEMAKIPFCDAIRSDEMPSFETLRRTRQKIQSRCPDLRANKKVQKYRSEKEAEYYEYARR